MGDNVQEKWETFLNPDVMRPALIIASLYITGFELLKDTIVDRPKGFFTNGFGPDGLHLDPAYQTDVLSKNKSVLYASLEWLKGMGTIDDSDLAMFERVKAARNTTAHQIHKLLTGGFPADFSEIGRASCRERV